MKTAFILGLLISNAAFATIPTESDCIIDRSQIWDLITENHLELVDPTCLKKHALDNDFGKAAAALGEKLVSVSFFYNSKRTVDIELHYGSKQHAFAFSCPLKR